MKSEYYKKHSLIPKTLTSSVSNAMAKAGPGNLKKLKSRCGERSCPLAWVSSCFRHKLVRKASQKPSKRPSKELSEALMPKREPSPITPVFIPYSPLTNTTGHPSSTPDFGS